MAASKLTPLAIAILELLHEKPMHPYEMTQLMRDRHLENRANVKPGSLYHTVERLVAAGYVEVLDTQREGRRPERTVYGMTEAGKDAFGERAKEMLSIIASEYPEYVSGLAVLDDLDREEALEQLKHRSIRLEAIVASQEVVAKRLREQKTPEVYWIDWRYVTAKHRFELEWTNRLIEDIEAGRLEWQNRDRAVPALKLIEDKDSSDDKAS